MKTLIIFFLIQFAVISVSAGEKKDWQFALSEHREGAYEWFLRRHPESKHKDEAIKKLRSLGVINIDAIGIVKREFESALGLKSSYGMYQFILNRPNSQYTNKVLEKLVEFAQAEKNVSKPSSSPSKPLQNTSYSTTCTTSSTANSSTITCY